MLVCYHNDLRLPQNDLIYLAFLFSLYETNAEIDLFADSDGDDDDPWGFLIEVPFLHPVPLPVQFDLLAETWYRHRTPELIEATLLDGAVVYAACTTAARIIDDEIELAVAWLKGSLRKLDPQILNHAPEQLEELFDDWWDDRDFHMLDDFLDMPPEKARVLKRMLRLPEEMVQPMFDVLERGRVSPDLGKKLAGLLPPAEIPDVVEVLQRH